MMWWEIMLLRAVPPSSAAADVTERIRAAARALEEALNESGDPGAEVVLRETDVTTMDGERSFYNLAVNIVPRPRRIYPEA